MSAQEFPRVAGKAVANKHEASVSGCGGGAGTPFLGERGTRNESCDQADDGGRPHGGDVS